MSDPIKGDMDRPCPHCGTVHRPCMMDDLEQLREALESLYDWQNGPPLLKRSWLNGWNDAMEKAAGLLGRKHERMDR